MSLAEQYTALYQLLYKRSLRDAYTQHGFKLKGGLTEVEREQLSGINPVRIEGIVQLHANDIGNNWYRPRFPATWIALQVALGEEQPALTQRFTQSDAFETRVDDDRDGHALTAFVDELVEAGVFENARWLPELMKYERMINGIWPDDTNPRVETFKWDVSGVADSLLEKQLFPMDEKPVPLDLLLYRDVAGVTEVALLPDQARIMKKLIAKQSTKDENPKQVAKCRRALRQIRE